VGNNSEELQGLKYGSFVVNSEGKTQSAQTDLNVPGEHFGFAIGGMVQGERPT